MFESNGLDEYYRQSFRVFFLEVITWGVAIAIPLIGFTAALMFHR